MVDLADFAAMAAQGAAGDVTGEGQLDVDDVVGLSGEWLEETSWR